MHLIATKYFPESNRDPQFGRIWMRMECFSTSQTPDIGSIVFSSINAGSGAPVYALFDRLRFCPHLPLTITHEIG